MGASDSKGNRSAEMERAIERFCQGPSGSKEVSCEELHLAVENFYSRLKSILDRHNTAVEAFLSDYHRWLEKRNEVIDLLSLLVSDIEKHHRNANIASLTGSSVSLVSGAACLAGLALAPFTAGLSTVLTAGGLLGSSAGTLTMTGAKIVEFGLKKNLLRKACVLVDEDCQETLHLSSLIESCQMQESEIQALLRESSCVAILRRKADALSKVVTNPMVRLKLQCIGDGSENLSDYIVLLSFMEFENIAVLNNLQEMKAIRIDPSVIQKTQRIFVSLRSSIVNMKQCASILKNWRAGLTTFRTASKASRFAKGSLIGLSMAVDVYDIGSTAKEMLLGEKLEEAENLRKIVADLQEQKNDVSEHFAFLRDRYTPAVEVMEES